MHVSLLLDFYGDILPERRYEMTSLYYNDDLSLSEIADICGISRQGVRDAVKKSSALPHDLRRCAHSLTIFQAISKIYPKMSARARARSFAALPRHLRV